MSSKRILSLTEFANNLPPGIVNDPSAGRYVFGTRAEDTLPYVVRPGADPAVKPSEVLNLPVTTQVFVFTYDLAKPEHHEQYEQVLNAIEARWFRLRHEERHWDKEKNKMMIYIEVVARHRVIEPQSEYDSLIALLNNAKPQPIK